MNGDERFDREPFTPASEYRPTTPPAGAAPGQTFADFRAEPATTRAAAYEAVALAIMFDLDSVPDEALALYGFGIYRDQDALQAARDNPEWYPTYALDAGGSARDWGTLPDGSEIIPPFRYVSEVDPDAAQIVGAADAAEVEALFTPTLAAGLFILFAGGYMALGGGTGAATGGGAYLPGALAAAAKLTGARSVAAMIAKAFAGAGLGGLALGSGNNALNTVSNRLWPEEHARAEGEQQIVAADKLAQSNLVQEAEQIYSSSSEPTAGATATPPSAAAPGTNPLAPWNVTVNELRAGARGGFSTQGAPPSPNQPFYMDPSLSAEMVVANWEARNADPDNPPVRVPQGWPSRERRPMGFEDWQEFRNAQLGVYRDSDVQETLANLSVGQLLRLQDLAVRAGLINPSSSATPGYIPGTRDWRTEDALRYFMGQANLDSEAHWLISAEKLAEAGDAARAAAEAEAEANRPRYVRRPYVAPDPVAVRQWAEDEAERELGRKMNDWEWTTLNQVYAAADRQKHTRTENAADALFEAQYRASQGQAVEPLGPYQDIDPEARFREKFSQLFEHEEARRDRTQFVAGMTGNLMQALRNAEAAVSR